MNEYMKIAKELANDNLKTNVGGPFGACIVKDGKITIYSNDNTPIVIPTIFAGEPVVVKIENEASGLHNYSTEEQVIGTWIDGKPLYEKTYSGNSRNINLESSICVVAISGCAYNDNGQYFNMVPTMYSGYCHPYVDNGVLITGIDSSAYPKMAITIHYIKTTDTTT